MSDVIPAIANLEKAQQRKSPLPEFRVGDTVRVWVLIKEGDKERSQAFEGVCIIEQNYRHRGGEIDLVADDAGTLCFIEVRSRGSSARGSAAETVNHKKQAKVARCAEHYLAFRFRGAPCPCRFDVVAVEAE